MFIHSMCFLSSDGNAGEKTVNPYTSISLKKTINEFYAHGILQIAKRAHVQIVHVMELIAMILSHLHFR